ncbi:MAG TPA: ROK family protein [Beutenbergiaceae bacterium]|nr:ROK family protein [Beutenbergiaceae bacterium]
MVTSPATAPVAVIDVGGTDTKTGVMLPDGTLTGTGAAPTPHGTDVVGNVLDLAAAHVAQARRAHPDLAAVGLVVPGIVDDEAGRAVLASNMRWQDVPFAALLSERTGLPAALGHDVASAGLAEVEHSAADLPRGRATDTAVIVIGTGIAAALFTEGRPLRGGGYAGELGHVPVAPEGPQCACGGRGCLETLASAGAIARRYTAQSGQQVTGAAQVLQAAQAGDEDAAAIWHEATEALARGITVLAAVLAPQVVILGGGLSGAGAALTDPVGRHLDQMLTVQRRPQIRLGRLGTHAGLHGAGILARQRVQEGIR